MLSLETQLAKRKQQGNLRELKIAQLPIDFASNDYLGLARSPALASAALQEWEKHHEQRNRIGATGSRLLTGNSVYAQELEHTIANFHGYEAGLLFNCGYMANIGLLSTIADQESLIFFDAAIHASMREGIRLSQAAAFPFRHNEVEHLESRLKRSSKGKNRFICIESIYSTDGSQAPLKDICDLANQYGAHVIVDEAHATGTVGPQGKGLVAEYQLTKQIYAHVTTFGKALGTFGAIVFGNDTLKQALINFASSYIYTTALPSPILASIKSSYELFPFMENERRHLKSLIHLFQKSYTTSSLTPIQPITIKGNEAIKLAAQYLTGYGFDIRPLMSPTVQRGKEVLRVCLHSFNTENEVRNLLAQLKTYER